jgi:hypothetical protein
MRGRRVVAALGVAGGMAWALSGTAAETVGLVPDGMRPELFLIYTGDVIGHVEPCG